VVGCAGSSSGPLWPCPLDRTEWISLIICLTGLLVALLLIWMIVNQRHYRQIALQPPEPIESKLAEATMTRTAMAIAALLVAGQAIAQDITLDGVARSVSLVNAIYSCGQYYPVDTALLERLFNDVGEQAAAKEGDGAALFLVGHDLGKGNAGVIVDADVHVFPPTPRLL
jgi:hypothetical protein